MSDSFLGEIRLMGFSFPPKSWALANGQFLPINQNQALFALFGTTYGGNGQTTFALPDFRGRVPIHFGGSHILGEKGGEESHTVSIAELPTHVHFLSGVNLEGTTAIPGSTVTLANSKNYEAYRPVSSLTTLHPASVGNIGGSQAHENRQPLLTISFCIALQGIFPSQN